MGGSWLKSLINVKKPPTTITDQSEDNRVGCNKKKWKLWSSSEGVPSSRSKGVCGAGSERSSDSSSTGVPSSRSKGVCGAGSEQSSDSSSTGEDAFAAAIATLARAPPRDFRMIKEEWAAIRIQAAFRGLLARRAFRALRAVVRIQAIFRGQQVRKQAAVTLRCMQALVRVQARVRARTAKMCPEGQNMSDEHCNWADSPNHVEQGWCNSPGTIDEVRAKMQMRKEGAMKRERAIAYARSQQQARACPSPLRRTNNIAMPLKHQRPDSSTASWTWLDRWMANKPWENSPGNSVNSQLHKISSETPFSRKSEDNIAAFYSDMAKHGAVNVRRNGVSSKILARPPAVGDVLQSYSAPSSETFRDESASTSSTSASPIPLPRNTLSLNKAVEENHNRKPSYMKPTESIKAKQQKASWYSTHKMHRHPMDDQRHTRSMELCCGDTKSNTGSNPSFSVSCDLYPPVPIDRQDGIKVRRPIGRHS